MTINLRSVTETAQNIHHYLKEDFDIDKAKKEAENLYQNGIQLVVGEVKGQPVFSEIALPVIAELNKIVLLDSAQHQFSFHNSLSKAYRIFVELTWHQYLQLELPASIETIDKTIENIACMRKTLPKDHIYTRFEYSCTMQAAKLLTSTKNVRNKYFLALALILELLGVDEKLSIISESKAFKKTIEYAEDKDWIKSWYPDVYYLRWISTQVKNTEGFDAVITPEIEHFQKEGGMYTVCLMTVLMEFITRPDTDSNCKKLAAKHVCNLLRLQDHSWIKRFVNWALEKKPDSDALKRAIKKWDPYWKMRAITGQYILEIDAQHIHYIYPIINQFIHKCHSFIHEGERKEIKEKFSALEKSYQEFEKLIKETTEAGRKEETKQAKEDIKEVLKNIAIIESEINVMKSILTALVEIEKEEQELLERVKKRKESLSELLPLPHINGVLFDKWKYGQQSIFAYHLLSTNTLAVLIQDQKGHQTYLNSDQVKCGISGNIPCSDFIRRLSSLTQKKIVAFPYSVKGEASEVWIFQSSGKAAPWIKEAKINLAQIHSKTDNKTIEVYQRALKYLEIALQIQKSQKGKVSELQSFIFQLKGSLLFLQAKENASLYFSSQLEIENVETILRSYANKEDIFSSLRRYLINCRRSTLSPSQNLIAALVYEILDEPASAIQSYLDLAEQKLTNPLPFLKKAELLAKTASDPSVFPCFLENFYAFVKNNLNPSALDPELKEWLQKFIQNIRELESPMEKKSSADLLDSIDEDQLSNIGVTFLDMEEPKESLNYLEKALAAQLKKGDVSLELATIHNRLGMTFMTLGDFQDALQHFQKALNIHAALSEQNSSSCALILENIGKTYMALKDFNKSLETFQKALKIRSGINQKNDSSLALNLDNIGKVYMELQEFNKALQFFERSLLIRLVLYGKSHSDTMKSFTNLGSWYASQKNYEEALVNFQKALKIGKYIQANAQDLSAVYHNLGSCLSVLGKHTEALYYINKSLYLLKSNISQKQVVIK